MAEATNIEWCDATFNPWIGCTKVSPGCDNCYAARQDGFRHWTPAGWGAGQPRKRTAPANWKQPVKWNTTQFFECPRCGLRGDARAMGDEPKGCKHLDARPARMRVFCSSLADVFDNEVDPEWRHDLFALIQATPNLDWLLLTKRIGNAHTMMDQALLPDWRTPLPLPNVWLGATIVNQDEADRDIPKLLATPARVRFLSMEPLLGPVDLLGARAFRQSTSAFGASTNTGWHHTGVSWVIVGGESGPGARPMHSELVRMLRDQCAAADVPFLFKQWGEYQPGDADCNDPVWPDVPESRLYWIDGSKWDRFDGQRPGVSICARIGKKAAGRLLDGVEHNGFPEAAQ